jgi:hypothetical protein
MSADDIGRMITRRMRDAKSVGSPGNMEYRRADFDLAS